ncbi:NfeD family protein [Allopusillimonas ginsengisoli]|uniref:NfeD family protein n=1 Tax=Allopusillimonas ginsengisoli TaxID=453575 RepID=UPI001020E556|nr:NfeD family protein [Allopusillimonas ginsengisoli]TEA74228.1 NfeD family protein [Allopusillimonas ginsengisoli]
MWVWFGMAALFLLLEMTTGTFYLLLIALGLTASGMAAYAGLSLVWQIISGLIISLIGLAAVHRYRRSKGHLATHSDPNVVQDIGQHITVSAWDENGQATVFYRGANWSARIDDGQPAQPGEHYIQAVQGLTLVLRPGRYPAPDTQH